MPTTITMPTLGESVVEGTVDHWLKQPGDTFNEFEPLVEVITDKVNAEVPAPSAGRLVQILVQPGDIVKVGQPIAVVEGAGETPSTPVAAPPPAEPKAAPVVEVPPEPKVSPSPLPEVAGNGARVSPSVELLAKERGIDLSRVVGTGLGGRVTRRDVLSYVEGQAAAVPAPAAPITPPAPAVKPAAPIAAPTGPGGSERIPLSTMRRMIAEHTTKSKTTVPHAWQVVEIDMSKVSAFRNRVKDEFRKREGTSLTYVPFIVKAAAESLREHPEVNAQFDGDAIIRHRDINVGVAIGMEEALVTPVVRQADSLSLAGIARSIADLSDRARKNKLTVADMQGGTITVNNVGTFGVVISYSIINTPQAAILTMEAVVDRVVVVDGMLAIRPMMFLCFSFDHRVFDGLQSARFLSSIKRRLESFDPDTAELY